MKFRLHHKELSLLAGIVVAVVILILWWLTRYTGGLDEAFSIARYPVTLLEHIRQAVSLAWF